jgi:NADH dehydrogenase
MTQNGKPLPGVAPVAIQQGHYVARSIISRIERESGPGPFHYFDKGNLATVGRAFAVLEAGKVKMSGFLAWFAWLAIHIFFLIGFRNRIVVLIQWAWAYVTYQRGARLITTPMPSHDHTEEQASLSQAQSQPAVAEHTESIPQTSATSSRN